MNILLLTLFVSLLISCQSPTSTDNELAKQMIGEWRNESLRLKVNSFNNKDSTVLVTATDPQDWEAKLKIKPIRTFFKEGGIYYSEYRNLSDSIFRRPTGEWFIKGDSIIMAQLQPDKSILRLQLSIKNKIATFQGSIDFDGDGKLDDEYFGTQKKMD